MGARSFLHDRNYGYGRNQKTCYAEALKSEADVIVMLHPDYQYSPRLVPAMAAMIVSEEYDVVMGSAILGGKARKSGMPLYKYISNCVSGYLLKIYCWGRNCRSSIQGILKESSLESLPIDNNSDDFMFDNEMLAQAIF